ncbi:MAG TPA: hypothetical protein VKS21_01005 [Spirochaetota bacterium]|nr:hypothetical protein [Spirochaetota bacterium]
MKKILAAAVLLSLLPSLLRAGWSVQLQSESEAAFNEGFVLAAEPKVKFSRKKETFTYHISLEWEIPLLPDPQAGELELESEFKLKPGIFSLGLQNELYYSLVKAVFADEISLEPYVTLGKFKLGADLEFDIMDNSKGEFSLEMEPTVKFSFFKKDAAELELEAEAPVLQLIKNGKKPENIIKSVDMWLIFSKKFTKTISIEILSGGGYNIIDRAGQYKIESACKIKL